MFQPGHEHMKGFIGRYDAYHAGWHVVGIEQREMASKLLPERTRPTAPRHPVTRHFDLPVHEAAWHVGFDGGFAERPPRLSPSAVWAVEDLTASGIGLDDGTPQD